MLHSTHSCHYGIRRGAIKVTGCGQVGLIEVLWDFMEGARGVLWVRASTFLCFHLDDQWRVAQPQVLR